MNVEIRYFSATGITKKVVTEFARGLGYKARFLDITVPMNRVNGISCETDLEVFAVPVHGGRIPGFIYRYLKSTKGNGRPLVTLAVYGNMGIGISLGQIDRLARESEFRLVGAGAFVGEHTFCRFGALRQAQGSALRQAQGSALRQAQGSALKQAQGSALKQAQGSALKQAQGPALQQAQGAGNHVGMGRPDQNDLMDIFSFGQKVGNKLEQGCVKTISLPKPAIPIFIEGFPERGTRFIVRQPDADPMVCERCGLCVKKCPVGAIHAVTFEIDGKKCIRCMACVHNCLASARSSQFKSSFIDRGFGWLGRKPKQNLMYY